MSTKYFRIVWIMVLLAGVTLACNLLAIPGQVRQFSGTAQAAVTQIEGIATEGKDLITTAQAYATENPGVIDTAQAYVNQVPGLISTAEAYATENPWIMETAQAVATENPGLLQTLVSGLSTGSSGQVPSNIPMPEGSQVSSVSVAGNVIFYTSPNKLADLVSFYRKQMVVKGWTADKDTTSASKTTILNFHDSSQTAMITLTSNDSQSTVVITLQNK